MRISDGKGMLKKDCFAAIYGNYDGFKREFGMQEIQWTL